MDASPSPRAGTPWSRRLTTVSSASSLYRHVPAAHFDAASRRVVVDVRQGERFAPYRFPLAIDVTDDAGGVHRVRVEIAAQGATQVTLPVELRAPPRALVFDPDVELLAEFLR